MATLVFSTSFLHTVVTETPVSITVPSGKIRKIESAGISDTNCSIFLRDSTDAKIAILFSTIGDNLYSAKLPFWLPESFSGSFVIEGKGKGSISVTEYTITA
jgi:hypothetical protein